MKNWSIRSQLILLALLPVMLTAISLSAYFTVVQLNQISENLRDHALSTASQIATTAEYALFSGNTIELVRSLEQVLADRDIVNIRITNHNDDTIVNLGSTKEPPRKTLMTTLLQDEDITVSQPVLSSSLSLSDFDDTVSQSNNQQIGAIYLTVNSYYSNIKKAESILKGGFISLTILALSIYVAIRISRHISRPVQKLTDAVKNIAAGDLNTHLDINAAAELGVLEACVNQMVEELQAAQSDMESRISEFTRELQETLTELEERNAELDIARSNAIQASKAKSEFLANMSHEIRTPLSGIIGFAELLETTGLDSHQQEYATIITESSRSLLAIIEEILDLSKIESGKLDIHNEDCDLVAITESIITLLTPAAQAKSIELFYDLHEGTPSLIRSDSLRVQQVLTNLIGNAVKFTERGYVYVHIETSPFDPGFIRIVVADTGIGLDAGDKSNLFKAFTQADISITRRFGGTGLGLVISRKLTQLLGGEIGFDSTPGEGSTFWFTLPIQGAGHSSQQYSPPLNKTIGLIDESYLTRKACRSMLVRWGCYVKEFGHAAITDASAFETSVDVWLVSLTLDDMKQPVEHLLDVLHRHAPNTPVLVLSSSHHEEHLQKLQRNGVNMLLTRTTPRERIRQALNNLIEQPEHIAHKPDCQSELHDSFTGALNALVVDDNEINLKLATIILERTGITITATKSGTEAVAAVCQQQFDIVFMDLHMPDMDGYVTTRQIRDRGTAIHQPYIVALTANAMPQEIKKAEQAGIDDVLIKPISEQQTHQLLRQWSQQQQIKPIQADKSRSESNAVYSEKEALSVSAGNTQLAQEMLDMLRKELPEKKLAIAQALRESDIETLKHHVHTLHGATRYCPTPALRECVKTFEQAIELEQSERFEALQQQLNREIDRVLVLDTQNLFQNPA